MTSSVAIYVLCTLITNQPVSQEGYCNVYNNILTFESSALLDKIPVSYPVPNCDFKQVKKIYTENGVIKLQRKIEVTCL